MVVITTEVHHYYIFIFIDFKFSLRIISAGVVIMVALLKVLMKYPIKIVQYTQTLN